MKCLVLTLVCTLLTPSVSWAEKSLGTAPDFEPLAREIEQILAEHHVPGATIAIVSGQDVIWLAGLGQSDVAAGTPVDPNKIFRWGSVSKSFVSAAVLILAERGVLDLDDKISDVIPEIEFHNRWESTHPVRIVHCLEHTAGFDDLHFGDCAVNAPDITLIDALAISPGARRSRWEPGTFTSYSNIGPAIAAYAIEKTTGQTFEDFVDENLFEPLGMKTASFFYPDNPNSMSKGYDVNKDGVTEIPYDHISLRPAGSLNASSSELASFVQMLLNRGTFNGRRILTSESVTRMETPTTSLAAQTGFPLGYALGNYTSTRNGFVFHGHDGMIGRFVASYGYNTELDRGYAVSINTPSDRALNEIIAVVIDHFVSGSEAPTQLLAGVKTPSRDPVEVPAKNMASLTGYYRSTTPMTELLHTLLFRFFNIRKVSIEDGRLYTGNLLSGRMRELVPLSENSFHVKDKNESLIFITGGDSPVMSYAGLRGNFEKTSAGRVFVEMGVFFLSLILMISSVVFAIVWIPRKLAGKMKEAPYLRARVVPFLAVLFFLFIYISLLIGVLSIEIDKGLMMRLGFVSAYSMAIFLSSICFALFSVLGLIFALRGLSKPGGKAARVHSLLVSIANMIAAVYLWFGGVIGFMPWAY